MTQMFFDGSVPGPAPRPEDRMNELQLKEIKKLEQQIESLVDRAGWIENEISELHGEQESIERQVVELQGDIDELRAQCREELPIDEDWEFHYRWACGGCTWDTAFDNDSARFRAEEHSRETGHLVQLLPAAGVPGFDEAIYEVAS